MPQYYHSVVEFEKGSASAHDAWCPRKVWPQRNVIHNRFLDSHDSTRIRQTFMPIYPLDGSGEGLDARKLAVANPENYVLKPQREGGGHNVFREDIPRFLESLSDEKECDAYILMELIKPPSQYNFIIREGHVTREEVVSELGVYGTIMWDKDGNVLSNNQGGWNLRTKPCGNNEGGVTMGFGAHDSVCLYS